MKIMWKGWAIAAILLSASAAAIGQSSTPDEAIARAVAARTAGDYRTAIRTLRDAIEAFPTKVELQILLAETLAWSKDFGAAETVYRQILAGNSASREARLGLARVLSWQERYEEASKEFGILIRTNPSDVDALEGHATIAYWTGDFRTAAVEFRRVLSIDPQRTFSRESLTAIESTARPSQRLDIDFVDDDQPYRTLRSVVTASVNSDPLTRWFASIGSHRLSSPIYGDASAPFASIANEAVIPRQRLTVTTRIGIMRYPDDVTRPDGALLLERQLTKSIAVSARAEKSPLLATATAVSSHPSVTTYALTATRDSPQGWVGAAELSALRYFDGNRGRAAWAYGLAPVLSRTSTRILAGAAATFRDSSESRFFYSAVSSARNGSYYDYSYRGEYRPYWAPQNLREGRPILVGETRLSSATLKLHLDGGIARDEAVGFGPDAGPSPLPPAIYPFTFDRTSHPSLVQLATSIPLTRGYSAEASFEISRTAYYRAKTFHAALVRRR